MNQRLKNAFHNIIIHPLAGFCWLCGCEKWGDWLHGEEDRKEVIWTELGGSWIGNNRILNGTI